MKREAPEQVHTFQYNLYYGLFHTNCLAPSCYDGPLDFNKMGVQLAPNNFRLNSIPDMPTDGKCQQGTRYKVLITGSYTILDNGKTTIKHEQLQDTINTTAVIQSSVLCVFTQCLLPNFTSKLQNETNHVFSVLVLFFILLKIYQLQLTTYNNQTLTFTSWFECTVVCG